MGRVTEKVTERGRESERKKERVLEVEEEEGGAAVKWDYNSITEASYICFNWTRSNRLGCPFVFWSTVQA